MDSLSVHCWWIPKTTILTAIWPFYRMAKISILTIFCHFGHSIKYWCSLYISQVHGTNSHMSKTRAHLENYWSSYGNFNFKKNPYAILVCFWHIVRKLPPCLKSIQMEKQKYFCEENDERNHKTSGRILQDAIWKIRITLPVHTTNINFYIWQGVL